MASTPSLQSSSSALSSQLIDILTHWCPETQHCLETKVVSDETCNDISRTLVTLLVAKYGSKPSRRQCKQSSRALILQYPFLKDDLGPGYIHSSHDTLSVASTPSVQSLSSALSSQLIDIPTHWRPESQHCLETKVVSDATCDDISRTLVTLLIAKYGSKPSRRQCEQASRALILQCPFLKDDLGPGYVNCNFWCILFALVG